MATALSSGASHAPDALLLDEPTFGQDMRTWQELVELLSDLRAEGRAVVAATHDAVLLDRFADVEIPLIGGCTRAPEARTDAGAEAVADGAPGGDAGGGPADAEGNDRHRGQRGTR